MHKYRSLAAWKHAHTLLIGTLRTTDRRYHPRSRALFDQIRRSAISVEANVVEGYALGTTALFRRHLRIAFGSAAEAETLLNAAREMEYLTEEDYKPLSRCVAETLRVIYGLMRSPKLRSRK